MHNIIKLFTIEIVGYLSYQIIKKYPIKLDERYAPNNSHLEVVKYLESKKNLNK